MITVDTLRNCAWLNSLTLEALIREKYPKDSVISSEFLGITNGGQFCYNIAFPGEEGLDYAKLYVWEDVNGKVVAEY